MSGTLEQPRPEDHEITITEDETNSLLYHIECSCEWKYTANKGFVEAVKSRHEIEIGRLKLK